MTISQRFLATCAFTLSALIVGQTAPAALFTSVDGTIDSADNYTRSQSDSVDAGTSFTGSEFDINTAHFAFEQDNGQSGIIVGFDVGTNADPKRADDAVSGGFTTVTLDLFGGPSGNPQVYQLEVLFFNGSSSIRLVDIDDGFSDQLTTDIQIGVDEDFEIGIPQSLVSDIFPESGTIDFGFSLQIDEPSNNDDDVTGFFESVPVPEPASAALIALGGVALLGRRARRQGH